MTVIAPGLWHACGMTAGLAPVMRAASTVSAFGMRASGNGHQEMAELPTFRFSGVASPFVRMLGWCWVRQARVGCLLLTVCAACRRSASHRRPVHGLVVRRGLSSRALRGPEQRGGSVGCCWAVMVPGLSEPGMKRWREVALYSCAGSDER